MPDRYPTSHRKQALLVIVHNADGYAGGIGKLSDEAQRIAPTLRIERAVVDHLDGVGERSEGGGRGMMESGALPRLTLGR